MAVVMRMEWPGITPQQYDDVRHEVDWIGKPDPAGQAHIATFDEGVLRCFDVWESAEALNQFLQSRILPAVQAVGVTTQPTIQVTPLHELFVTRVAGQSLPEQNRVEAVTPV
jgi:hypothetical protein